jgi:hypothetical protein
MNRLTKSIFLCLLAALLVAGCGDKKSSSESPETAIKSALDKTAQIKSANAAINANLSTGSLPGSFDIKGSGPFDTEAEGGAAFDLDLSISVAGTEQKFGFASVDGKNYVKVGDKAIERKGDDATIEPGQISDFIAGLGKYITNAKSEGETNGLTTYTATVNVKQLIEDNAGATGSSSLSKLSVPGLGSAGDLKDSLSTADITLGVNADGIAQTLEIDLPIKQGTSTGGVRATITLTDINQPVTIEAPKNVVDDASDLGALGGMLAQ